MAKKQNLPKLPNSALKKAASSASTRQQSESRRSPAEINRTNYFRSQGVSQQIRPIDRYRARLAEDATEQAASAALRAAAAARAGLQRQTLAADLQRQAIARAVMETGVLPEGYKWHNTGGKDVAVRDLAHRPLEGVETTITQYHRAAQNANETYGKAYGQARHELGRMQEDYDKAATMVERGNQDERYAAANPNYRRLVSDNKKVNLAGREQQLDEKRREIAEMDAAFDEVEALRPAFVEPWTVRDSQRMQDAYYQKPTIWNNPLLSPIVDTVDGAYQMLTNGQSLKGMDTDDKEGIGVLRSLGAGSVMAGNQFNDFWLGVAENALDLGSPLAKAIVPGWENPITAAREKNAQLGQAAYGDELANATEAEKVLMNLTSSTLNSAAHMATGGLAGAGLTNVLGLAPGAVNPMMYQTRMQPLVNAANMSSFTLSSMTNAYDRAEERGANPLRASMEALTAGIGSMAANSNATEGFMKRMGLGVDPEDIINSRMTGDKMIRNWGDAALQWAKDAFGKQGMAEGAQEVLEAIFDKSLEGAWTGQLANPEFWQGFGEELGENAFYGYLSGALYSTMAMPAYAPSQQMLGQMVAGELDSSPENGIRFVEQVAADLRDPDIRKAVEAQAEAEKSSFVPERIPIPASLAKTAEDATTNAEQQAEEAKTVRLTTPDRFAQALEGQNNDGDSVQVLGIEQDGDGKPYLRIADQSGERNAALEEISFADDAVQELMTQDAIKGMDAQALNSYLSDYDASRATPDAYAQAYGYVYRRAANNVPFAQAVTGEVQQLLGEQAQMDAYANGLRRYQPEGQQETAHPRTDNVGESGVVRSYSKEAWQRLNRSQRRAASAQMEIVNALGKRTGRSITVVDHIAGPNGQKVNGRYNTKTGTIEVALDADAGAYAYVALHELTHAMRNEHGGQWDSFVNVVRSALERRGQSMETMVDYQQKQFGYDADTALEEVICNTAPAMLNDDAVLEDLYRSDRTLFERVMEWVETLIKDIRSAGKALSERSRSWAQMDALAGDREAMQKLYSKMTEIMGNNENVSSDENVEATKYSISSSESQKGKKESQYYDYSKPFAEQVEDLLNGNFPKDSALIVSGTPDVLRKIGFSSLPLTMNQEHLLKMHKDTEHELSYEFIRQLPELIKNPIAVIGSETNAEKSLVMILHAIVNKKPYIAPMYISTNSSTINARIDSNNISTIFRKANAITNLLTDALQNEKANKVGVYYWNKTEARSLFEGAGVQFPGSSIQDGLIHSIFDAGSPVNAQFMEQTETRQFWKWFDGSQVVNPDGTPKIMYHGTATEFWAFDKKKANDMTGRRLGLGAGKGKFYLTEYKGSAQLAADSAQQTGRGSEPKVMELYVSAKKVMDRSEYDRLLQEAYKRYPNSNPRGEAYDYRQRDKAIASVDKAITKEGYDGVWDKESGEMFVYENTQIKSATENIGLFDKRNPDIRYSVSDYNILARTAEQELDALLGMTGNHTVTDAEMDKLASKVVNAVGSRMDRKNLSQRFGEVLRMKKLSAAELNQEVMQIAQDVLDQSQRADAAHEEAVTPLRTILRSSPVYLNTSQKNAAAKISGDYVTYKRQLGTYARTNLRTGMSLDDMYEQLTAYDSAAYPADVDEATKVQKLLDAAEEARPVYITGMGAEESVQWMADKIFSGYMALPSVQRDAENPTHFAVALRNYRNAIGQFEKSSHAMFDEAYANVLERYGRKVQRGDDYDLSKMTATEEGKQLYRQVMDERRKAWRQQVQTGLRRQSDVARIYRQTNDLLRKLEKPTDKKHVQDPLRDTAVSFLKALNLGGHNSTVRNLSSRIARLRVEMNAAQNPTDSGVQYIVDPSMLEKMDEMMKQLDGVAKMDQLTPDQLHELSAIVGYVNHVMTYADEAFADNRKIRIGAMAGRTMDELSRRKDIKNRGPIAKKYHEFLDAAMMDAFHFFDRLGNEGRRMLTNLREGLDRKIRHWADATDYVEEAVKVIPTGMRKDLFAGKDATKTTYKVSGGTVDMTRAQVMELYCLSKRENAQLHLYEGGIRTGEDGQSRAVLVTPEDVERITSKLTAEEKQLADKLQEYLSNQCSNWGNETSLQLYGYKKFTEQMYWPMRVDPTSVETNISEAGKADNLYAILGMGFTKTIKDGAHNALYIGDAFDTFARHVDNISKYSGYAAPIADMVRWYNYNAGGDMSVKGFLERKFGRAGMEYIPTLIRNLNGESDQSYDPKLTSKMFGNMKAAAVGRNLRVVIQQPTAILRAGDMMSYKHIFAGMLNAQSKTGRRRLREAIELAKAYCPIAKLKSMGYFETNVANSLRTAMFDDRGALDKVKDEGMWLAGQMDEMTFGMLWRACESETREMHPELTAGSEEFYTAVGKRLSDVIDYTQVVDTTLHRSQLMRSSNPLVQMSTTFMSEPTKTLNMLVSSWTRMIEHRHDTVSNAKFVRTVGVYGLTAIINAMAQSLIDAIRDDDDEAWWKRFTGAMFGDYSDAKKLRDYFRAGLDANVISGLNPLNMIPYVKDLLSLVQGYDLKRTDMQSVEKLVQIGQQVGNALEGKNKQSGWGWAKTLAGGIDAVTGLGLNNALRDGYAVTNLLSDLLIGKPIIDLQTEDATTTKAYDNLYSALLSGDEGDWNRLSGKMAAANKSEKDIDAEMGERLKEEDAAAEAYAAKIAGRGSEVERLRKELMDLLPDWLDESRRAEIVDKAIVLNAPKEKTREETDNPLSVKLFATKDAAQAVMGMLDGSTSKADVTYIMSELAADSTAKDPAKTVRTNVLSECKKLYKDADAVTRKLLGDVIKDLFGVDDAYLKKWLE